MTFLGHLLNAAIALRETLHGCFLIVIDRRTIAPHTQQWAMIAKRRALGDQRIKLWKS